MRKLKLALIVEVVALALLILIPACTVPQTVTNPDGSTSTVQVPDPKLVTGIEAARAGNAASAPFNPFAYLINLGLLAATGAAMWVAKRKNDKASANARLLKTVI